MWSARSLVIFVDRIDDELGNRKKDSLEQKKDQLGEMLTFRFTRVDQVRKTVTYF